MNNYIRKRTIIFYSIGILFIVGGVLSTYFLATTLDESLDTRSELVYVNEASIVSRNIISRFKDIVIPPTIVDTLTVFTVGGVSDFDIISSTLINTEGVTRVTLIEKIKYSDREKFEKKMSQIYNENITLSYAGPPIVEDDLWPITYISPYSSIGFIGFVTNSIGDISNSIGRIIESEDVDITDNINTTTEGIGRIVSYPIFTNSSISYILSVTINYDSFFDQFTRVFLESFPESTLGVFLDDKSVFQSGKMEYIMDNADIMEFIEKSCNLSVKISNIDHQGDNGGVFTYILTLGISITLMVFIVIVLIDKGRERAVTNSNFKSRFIADMSHEIRTPMNGIIGMTELLSELPLDSASRYYVRTIKTCGGVLLRIINDILDMSKIEAGLVEIHTEPIHITRIVRETVENIWETFKVTRGVTSKSLEAMLIMENDIPEEVIGDRGRIQQILSNIFTNSMKFTDRGAITITMSVKERTKKNVTDNTRMIVFSVKDTGIGMKQSDIPNAFKPFKQVHSRSGMGGTGLGLCICKELCTLMGGNITCTSQIGTGTTIVFTIEVGLTENATTIPHTIKIYTNSSIDIFQSSKICSSESDIMDYFRNMKEEGTPVHPEILVVDDVNINRQLISSMLSTIGITVHTCDNGLQAIQMCDVRKYSMILMDMVMPVMDGLEATKLIRKGATNRSTPIIFVSANAQSNSTNLCTDAGGNGFIPKPIGKRSIIETLIKYSSKNEQEYVRRYVSEESDSLC